MMRPAPPPLAESLTAAFRPIKHVESAAGASVRELALTRCSARSKTNVTECESFQGLQATCTCWYEATRAGC